MRKKLGINILAATMVLMLGIGNVSALGTGTRDLENEKSLLIEDLKDGYGEVGKYKIEEITDGVYHMDEGTKALPGGANDENGNMNNPSSIYFVDEGDSVLIVDGGNPVWNNEILSQDAQIIVEAICQEKKVDVVFTHGHYDHLGLQWSNSIMENINLNNIYIEERDNIDDQYNVLYSNITNSKNSRPFHTPELFFIGF